MSDQKKPRVFLLRHAHASPGAGISDIERPLDEQGRLACAELAGAISAAGYRFDRILCSPAKRTRQTLELIRPALQGMPDEHEIATLYSQGMEAYFQAVRSHGSEAVLVVGHNPMTHAFARSLASGGDEKAMAKLAKGFPTAALAVIEFDVPLAEIATGGGWLTRLFRPKKNSGAF
ncbi:SixA phosphatase family protein [Consotaella salsifontis]|uniref:Phosphohistidine phosphatase n=1 Tax=Consotaella salsifontis TaxID=1365950 RepID=A0A1T4P7H5_9HYPH|nr:histidine phosphatase family protein [Consotaella salsifontis]SJZ87525.1 phosphohistidine phosphatase [Consotaella salsifontis]